MKDCDAGQCFIFGYDGEPLKFFEQGNDVVRLAFQENQLDNLVEERLEWEET